MAKRVNVVLEDDIDKTEPAETVTFALDGVQYEIDLSQENADRLREAVALYIAHGRRAGGRRRGGSGGGGRSTSTAKSSGGPAAAEIRAWARDNGFDVPDRGRISAEVREAYAAAN